MAYLNIFQNALSLCFHIGYMAFVFFSDLQEVNWRGRCFSGVRPEDDSSTELTGTNNRNKGAGGEGVSQNMTNTAKGRFFWPNANNSGEVRKYRTKPGVLHIWEEKNKPI